MSGLFAGTSLERPVTCAVCAKPLGECACPRDASGRVCRPKDQRVRVRRERRRGKFTTVIAGLDPKASDLPALLATFRKRFGTGGAIVDSDKGARKGDGEPEIELQGDHRDGVLEALRSMGYDAKAAGG